MQNENILSAFKELTNSYEDYYKSNPAEPFDLQAFSLWLYNQEGHKKKSLAMKNWSEEMISSSEKINIELPHGSADDQISFIFLSMHKLIKFYVKKVLDGTQLVSLDDIHFLMFLSATESLTKSEIINSSINEMSSGIEIIKRLQKKGLIEDFADPDDKRSRRVKITQKGLSEISKVTSKFSNVHRLLGKAVPEDEKYSLLATLNNLYEFHLKIYNNEKNTPIEELFEKYLKNEKKKN